MNLNNDCDYDNVISIVIFFSLIYAASFH